MDLNYTTLLAVILVEWSRGRPRGWAVAHPEFWKICLLPIVFVNGLTIYTIYLAKKSAVRHFGCSVSTLQFFSRSATRMEPSRRRRTWRTRSHWRSTGRRYPSQNRSTPARSRQWTPELQPPDCRGLVLEEEAGDGRGRRPPDELVDVLLRYQASHGPVLLRPRCGLCKDLADA